MLQLQAHNQAIKDRPQRAVDWTRKETRALYSGVRQKMMKYLQLIILTFLSFSVTAEEDSFKYYGSYTSERYTEEHYYLTEFWLWEKDSEFIGLFFVWGGLGGNGAVTPMIIKIDSANLKPEKDFTLKASSFVFVGNFKNESIIGDLTNGGANWNGGVDNIIFISGTNIKTIQNPGASLKTYQQWNKWVTTLDKVH
jgi:hypothetical protein